jgi:hypothetical protein
MISVPKAIGVLGAALVFCIPGVAHAYMGPGLGLGFLGAVFGVIGSIFLGIVAIIWYPIKRLWRKLRPRRDNRPSDPHNQTPEV